MIISVLVLLLISAFEAAGAAGGALVPPVIDLKDLLSAARPDKTINASDPATRAVAVQIGKACRRWGFFQIVNHGIDTSLLVAIDREMNSFFSSPLELKNSIRRQHNNSRGFSDAELTKQLQDMKELFDVGHKPYPSLEDSDPENVVMDGFNQWPDNGELPTFRPAVEAYYAASANLAKILMSVAAYDLGENISFFESFFEEHTSFLRLNYYPPSVASDSDTGQEGPLGISRHTDAGALTILLQDHRVARGLEVYSGSKQDQGDGAWVPVLPVHENALTVNVGDMLQVWSNKVYKAAEHRVRARETGDTARYSAPFFYNPAYNSLVSPITSASISKNAQAVEHGLAESCPSGQSTTCVADDDATGAFYRPILWGEFRRRRFEGDYADTGKEVQIEDFSLY